MKRTWRSPRNVYLVWDDRSRPWIPSIRRSRYRVSSNEQRALTVPYSTTLSSNLNRKFRIITVAFKFSSLPKIRGDKEPGVETDGRHVTLTSPGGISTAEDRLSPPQLHQQISPSHLNPRFLVYHFFLGCLLVYSLDWSAIDCDQFESDPNPSVPSTRVPTASPVATEGHIIWSSVRDSQ